MLWPSTLRASLAGFSEASALFLRAGVPTGVTPSKNSVDWCYVINPYPTAFPYGNGMVLHFYQQEESSTTKTVHKVINKGLKTYV